MQVIHAVLFVACIDHLTLADMFQSYYPINKGYTLLKENFTICVCKTLKYEYLEYEFIIMLDLYYVEFGDVGYINCCGVDHAASLCCLGVSPTFSVLVSEHLALYL
jgi:hypothetical protein